MLKNLILVVLLISLLVIPLAVTGCPKSEQPTPPATTAAKQPSPAPTPKAEEVITVSEFVERTLSGKYKIEDVVLVSGTVIDGRDITLEGGELFAYLILGPKTSEYQVKVTSKTYTATLDPETAASRDSFAKARIGDTVTVRGTSVWIQKNKKEILIRHASVIHVEHTHGPPS